MVKVSASLPNALIALDRSAGTSLHRQIYEQVRAAIFSGQLAAGMRLPPTRELADDLGVARNTVMNAFDQLHAESYLERRVGDGTYVSRELPDDLLRVKRTQRADQRPPSNGAVLSKWGATIASISTRPGTQLGKPRPFRTSTPAIEAFPYKVWGRLLVERWNKSAQELLPYGDPAGYLPLRQSIAAYLSTTRAVRCTSDQVIIVSGSLHGLEIVTRLLLEPGDAAWIEDPGFLGARAALIAAGARLVPVPVGANGLDLAAGVARCARPRLIYVTPSHQYPLGMTLPLSQRLALLQLASETGAWIIEDDYDSEFRYTGRPLAALQGLDGEHRVIYLGTLSKVLFPALRIGYIVAPPGLIHALVSARSLAGHQSPTLEQAVLADFIRDGHFARHIRRMRSLYAERQATLVKAGGQELNGLLELTPSEAGMHLMGWLPDGVDDRAAVKAAAARGVEVTALSSYCIEPPSRCALRLGYTGYTRGEIWAGVRRLATALQPLVDKGK